MRTGSANSQEPHHSVIVFAGGCARNTYLQRLFENRFRTKILVNENPDMLAALGAALCARYDGTKVCQILKVGISGSN